MVVKDVYQGLVKLHAIIFHSDDNVFRIFGSFRAKNINWVLFLVKSRPVRNSTENNFHQRRFPIACTIFSKYYFC